MRTSLNTKPIQQSSIAQAVADLDELDVIALRERWSELTGTPAPKVRQAILRLALAWELQASALGGHSPSTRRQLGAINAGKPLPVELAAGTRLVREWNGVLYTVTVGADGVIRWDGKDWKSLSAVARAITGSRWSGPVFFGLKSRGRGAA